MIIFVNKIMCLFSLSNCQMDYKLQTYCCIVISFPLIQLGIYSWSFHFFAFFIKISQVVILGISIAYLIILFFKVYAQHWGNCIFLLNLFQYHMNITAYLIIAYMFINLKSKGNKTYEKPCLNLYSVVDTIKNIYSIYLLLLCVPSRF